jgi:phage gp36-like protein
MGTLYCTESDLTTIGINALAFVDVSPADQSAAIVGASALIDDHIGGRYPLPLLAFPSSFTYHCAKIAVYICLSVRGYNPDAGADPSWVKDYEKALAWAQGIQRQEIHPQVTVSAPSPGNPTYDLPKVSSSPQRGYAQFNSRGTPVIS